MLMEQFENEIKGISYILYKLDMDEHNNEITSEMHRTKDFIQYHWEGLQNTYLTQGNFIRERYEQRIKPYRHIAEIKYQDNKDLFHRFDCCDCEETLGLFLKSKHYINRNYDDVF